MSILKNIGNRLRRDDNDRLDKHAAEQRGSWGKTHAAQQQYHPRPNGFFHHNDGPGFIASRLGGQIHGVGPDDIPDLYYEDRELGETVHALEQLREILHEVSNAANAHKDMLCATAASQRNLGECLVTAVESTRDEDYQSNDQNFPIEGSQHRANKAPAHAKNYADLDNDLRQSGSDQGPEENDENETAMSRFLSLDAIASQVSLGNSFVVQSGSMIKLGVALCNPINELYSSFEERYNRKIDPLRRRYMDQKGQYLKYKRFSETAEDQEKRSYYDALAQAAKPVWIRTSKELRAEAHVMTEVTSRNIAKWGRSLALLHERSLAIAASNFADAFSRAKGK